MRTPIIIVFAILLSYTFSFSQVQDFDVIPYKYGKFEGKLPSGKKFFITGPLIHMDKPPADVVILNIYKVSRKSKTPQTCPHYSGYFWKPKGDDSQQFKIFVDKPLLFSRNYKFEFQYFSSAQYTAGNNILSAFTAELDRYFASKKSLNENDLITMLADVNLKLKNKSFGTLGFVPNSSCNNIESFQYTNEIQVVSFPIKTDKGDVSAAELAGLITDRYLFNKNTANIAQLKTKISNLQNDSDVKDGIKAMEQNLSSSSTTYTQNDIDKLKSFFSSGYDASNPVPDFSALFSDPSIFSGDQLKKIGELISYNLNLPQEEEALNKNKAKVVTATAKLGSYEDIVLKGFTLSGTSISYNTIEFDQKVQTDAVKATTPAGISGVLLNPEENGGPSEFDTYGNAAIRTYFYPVDKRHSGKLAYVPWGRPFNRMSATFGISFSPISYRGEKLKPAIGVKPVFAIGYDVTRSFSIDIGGILFRQDSPSILNDKSNIRFAPVISIQFDADLFNRFKSLGSGESFQLGTQ